MTRDAVIATPGPMDATMLSKMRVKLYARFNQLLLNISIVFGVANVSRSGEIYDPTEPCGHPVPPYAIELMVTSVGFGPVAEVVTAGDKGGAAKAAAENART